MERRVKIQDVVNSGLASSRAVESSYTQINLLDHLLKEGFLEAASIVLLKPVQTDPDHVGIDLPHSRSESSKVFGDDPFAERLRRPPPAE